MRVKSAVRGGFLIYRGGYLDELGQNGGKGWTF